MRSQYSIVVLKISNESISVFYTCLMMWYLLHRMWRTISHCYIWILHFYNCSQLFSSAHSLPLNVIWSSLTQKFVSPLHQNKKCLMFCFHGHVLKTTYSYLNKNNTERCGSEVGVKSTLVDKTGVYKRSSCRKDIRMLKYTKLWHVTMPLAYWSIHNFDIL